MNIERHRLQRERNAGAYMEPASDGNWVRHGDHAAALAAMTERAALVKAEHAKEIECVLYWNQKLREARDRAERYVDGQNLRSDYRTATEMRAALEHFRDDLNSTREELARVVSECELRAKEDAGTIAVLRAECEAWRAANGTHDWTGNDDGPPYHITSARIAMSMTDAAGALKGGTHGT